MLVGYYPIEDHAQAQIDELRRRGARERLINAVRPSLMERVKEWIHHRLDLRGAPHRAPAAQSL